MPESGALGVGGVTQRTSSSVRSFSRPTQSLNFVGFRHSSTVHRPLAAGGGAGGAAAAGVTPPNSVANAPTNTARTSAATRCPSVTTTPQTSGSSASSGDTTGAGPAATGVVSRYVNNSGTYDTSAR